MQHSRVALSIKVTFLICYGFHIWGTRKWARHAGSSRPGGRWGKGLGPRLRPGPGPGIKTGTGTGTRAAPVPVVVMCCSLCAVSSWMNVQLPFASLFLPSPSSLPPLAACIPFAPPSFQEAPQALALYAACHFALSTFCFSASLLLLLLLIVVVVGAAAADVVVGIFALRCRWRCRCTAKLLLRGCCHCYLCVEQKQQQRETTLHCLLFVWFSAKTLLLLPLPLPLPPLLLLLPFLPLCQFLPLPFWQARNESKLKQKPNNLTANATATLAAVR